MWCLVKSEYEYNLKRIPILLILFPVIYYLKLAELEIFFYNLGIFYIIFLTMMFLVSFKNKELRERTFNTLPVKRIDIAISRLITVLLPLIYYTIIMVLFEVSISKFDPDLNFVVISFSLSVISFALYLIMRDTSLRLVREKGITKNNMKTTLVFAILILNILAVILVFLTKEGLEIPLNEISDFLKMINPFKGEYTELRLIITAIILSLVSLTTYTKGKFHME
ncbi:MAG: ABC-2 transporter permease [Melioribacteraceae bacterium]|nr:ABC-2 transporter permease [Melioribacteraceae bacterium]